ncbi:YfcL family protein [Photobacterium leiognathi]|uniref:YfcL family protein n=1 Tax=Photobacterium leiognathi TaxID=553611 RepID=UPI0027398959|nr:YfcL family protein [Photobacterium leiognathi]
MTIQEYEEKLLQLIDDGIDTATDDELFAGGYLRGHISLAAAECELSSVESVESVEIMKAKIVSNINKAKRELTPQDFNFVVNFTVGLLRK